MDAPSVTVRQDAATDLRRRRCRLRPVTLPTFVTTRKDGLESRSPRRFEAASAGRRTMPAFKDLSQDDAEAVAAWIVSLQRAQGSAGEP